MTKYAYSTDEEMYHGTFDSAEEAIEESCVEVGSTIWIGETVPYTAHQFVPKLESFLESINEAAGDEVGESAESWMLDQLHAAAMTELQHALDAFAETLQRVAPPTFYGLKNVTEHVFLEIAP